MKWIQRCWINDRTKSGIPITQDYQGNLELTTVASEMHSHEESQKDDNFTASADGPLSVVDPDHLESSDRQDDRSPLVSDNTSKNKQIALLIRWVKESTQQKSTELVLSPRRRLEILKNKSLRPPVFVVTSPFPYAVMVLLGVMIILIFVNVIPIAGLISIFAVSMIVTVVMGNHWRAQQVWVEIDESSDPSTKGDRSPDVFTEAIHSVEQQRARESLGPLTREDEVDCQNRFFEALYASIDYNLLLIFLGLFIVIANLSDTGIPRTIWDGIVGPAPFQSFVSVFDISGFVLFASQLVGNVPIIQLAKPNVEGLDADSKRIAWAVLSFVATVGGNLTLTGSAANIIVAEKAARLDATMSIDFFRHYHVCFWVTLFNCFVGACMISVIAIIDNTTGSNW